MMCCCHLVNADFSPTEQDMYIHYRALYTYAIVLYWLNEEPGASPEEISGQVWDLISQKRFYWLFGRRVPEQEEKARRPPGDPNEAGLARSHDRLNGGKKSTRRLRFPILPVKATSAVPLFMTITPTKKHC